MTTALSIRNLKKIYQNGFEALKGIDFDVAAGDFGRPNRRMACDRPVFTGGRAGLLDGARPNRVDPRSVLNGCSARSILVAAIEKSAERWNGGLRICDQVQRANRARPRLWPEFPRIHCIVRTDRECPYGSAA